MSCGRKTKYVLKPISIPQMCICVKYLVPACLTFVKFIQSVDGWMDGWMDAHTCVKLLMLALLHPLCLCVFVGVCVRGVGVYEFSLSITFLMTPNS